MKHLRLFNEGVDEDDLSDILDALQYLTDSSPKYISNDMTKYHSGFLALYYEDCESFDESGIHVINYIISKIGYEICSYDFRNKTLYLLIMTLSFLDTLYKKGIELIRDVSFHKNISRVGEKISGQIDLKGDDYILIEMINSVNGMCIGDYYIFIGVKGDEFEFTNKVEADMELINIQLKYLGINNVIKRMSVFNFNEHITFNDTIVKEDPRGIGFVRKGDNVSILYDDENRIGTLHYRIKDEVLHIVMIEINQKYRGNKYGTKVMEEIFARAKKFNCNSIKLEVLRNNIAAINLYKKFGFSIDGEDGHFLDMSINL